MDDLLNEFIAESREMLDAVQEQLVAWEADPGDRARLDAIFRFVHTVKGNCGFFDLPRLAALSHAAESALDEVRAGDRSIDSTLVDAIFAVVDRIGDMIDALDAGEELPEGSDEALILSLGNNISEPENEPSVDGNEPDDTPKRGDAAPVARSIRLPVTLLDQVMSEISDLVLVRNELGRHLRETNLDPTILSTYDRLNSTIEDLREDIAHMRMHRLDHLYGPLPRLLRDLSNELGKKVSLVVEGGQVELDREIIELIRDPMVHILRNAVDHGIETPEERANHGKPESGNIEIHTRQTGNRISIAILDDGRGIDTDVLVEKARKSKVISKDEADAMSHADKLELIFEPGLSTASEVTSVSGRGVGMDVVRANIERLGGTISVTSELGEGTRLFISLPATLSIVPSITVQVGEHRFGIPRSYVEEIVSSRSDRLEFTTVGDAQLVEFAGQKVRCCQLSDALAIEGNEDGEQDLAILKLAGGDIFALAVDQVTSHEDMVVRPLSDPIMASNLYTGASLLDDGSLVLMLHIAGLSIQQGLLSDIVKKKRVSTAQNTAATQGNDTVPAVLFSTLDGDRQLVRMESVNRIAKIERSAIRFDEKEAQVVIDDAILPLAGMENCVAESDRVNLLILGDGTREIAYLIDAVADTIEIPTEVTRAKTPGEIEGVVLVEGRAVEVLDCHWLFSTLAPAAQDRKARKCRIDLGSQWASAILRPLVEGAGYRVIDADADEEADLAILLETDAGVELQAAETITLYSDPDNATSTDDGAYRYDRNAIIELLKAKKRRAA